MIGLLIAILGIVASAFFSGIETGYYRVPRIRIVLDASEKGWLSKQWLWFINRPAAFVSTVLVGNNIANYLVSLGLVLLTSRLFNNTSESLAVIVPVLTTPMIFVYGELLPKIMYFQIPTKLLRLNTIPFAIFAILLAPVSLLLYLFSFLLQKATGYTPLTIRSDLERKELHRIIDESREEGVLSPLQQKLAQNLLVNGSQSINRFSIPLRSLRIVPESLSTADLRERVRHSPHAFLLVRGAQQKIIGYFRINDCEFATKRRPELRSMPRFASSLPQIRVLTQLIHQRLEMAIIVDDNDKEIGIVTTKRLWALALRNN